MFQSNVFDLYKPLATNQKIFCFKNCSDLWLFEYIVRVISKMFQIQHSDFSFEFQKVFLDHKNIFFQNRSEQIWKENTIYPKWSWFIPGTETWSSIDEEFLTITCWVRLAPLMVGLCDTSLGTFSATFFTSGSSTGDRTANIMDRLVKIYFFLF